MSEETGLNSSSCLYQAKGQYKILKVKAIPRGWLPEYEALSLPGGLFDTRLSVSCFFSRGEVCFIKADSNQVVI